MPFLPDEPEREARLEELLEEAAHSAAVAAVERATKRAAIGFLVLFIGFLGTLAKQEHDDTAQTKAIERNRVVLAVTNCNRDFRTITQVRGVLEASRASTEEQFKAGRIDERRYRRAAQFYNIQIANLQLPDCRTVTRTIVGNVGRLRQKPLYPGSPEAEKFRQKTSTNRAVQDVG